MGAFRWIYDPISFSSGQTSLTEAWIDTTYNIDVNGGILNFTNCVIGLQGHLNAGISGRVTIINTHDVNFNFGEISEVGSRGDSNSVTINIGGLENNRPCLPWLVNVGKITNTYFSTIYIESAVNNAQIYNQGTIEAGGLIKIDSSVIGNGTIKFVVPYMYPTSQAIIHGEIDANGYVSSGQVVDMTNDGILKIGDLSNFHASVVGFTGNVILPGLSPADVAHYVSVGTTTTTHDVINLTGLNVDALEYSVNGNRGTLTLLTGGQVDGTITFIGNYNVSDFVLSHSGGDSVVTHI